MTSTFKKTLLLTLSLLLLFSLLACGEQPKEETGLWAEATYTTDQTFGDGAKTVTVKVTAEDKTVTFTIKTDKETVGDALLEHGLIEGDMGAYGIYIKRVNGILADFDIDQTYWAFHINGELAMTGVDGETINESATYSLVRTK